MSQAPSRDEILRRLQKELQFSSASLELMADNLVALTEPVAGAFADWWRSGRLPELVIEGHTVARIISERGDNVYAAFVALDGLNRCGRDQD